MQLRLIRIGSFFFSYRNRVFPLITLGLFALAAPPAEIFNSVGVEQLKDVIALGIASAGVAFRLLVIGFVYIKRGGLRKKVYAESLVTHGMFGVCRNPLYVGNLLICLGVFLMHGNPLVMALGITTYVFIYRCIVLAEESYLTTKFGKDYERYCRHVPRWIPKISNFQRATQGMSFDLRRALIRDYSTIALTVITLALTEGYEDLTLPAPPGRAVASLAVIVVCVAVTTGIIRVLKKWNWQTESK